jgi:Zn-dependent protease
MKKRNKIEINRKELFEILKAWIAISLAFGILLAGPFRNEITVESAVESFVIALFTVGLGFLVHELAHKIIAIKYKAQAEFKADNKMLILAIAMSFLGFIFAAPGAVHIKGFITKVQNGLVSLAGPLTNLILALLFLPGLFLFEGLLGTFFMYGFYINSWLGLFNMIPFGNFDGAKIYSWNKPVFFSTALTLLVMTLFGILIF